jgi:hypothetical protein
MLSFLGLPPLFCFVLFCLCLRYAHCNISLNEFRAKHECSLDPFTIFICIVHFGVTFLRNKNHFTLLSSPFVCPLIYNLVKTGHGTTPKAVDNSTLVKDLCIAAREQYN